MSGWNCFTHQQYRGQRLMVGHRCEWQHLYCTYAVFRYSQHSIYCHIDKRSLLYYSEYQFI
jgi:hypothetical protein